MTKTKGLLFAAGIALAMAFTLSCSDDKENNTGGGSAPPVPSTTSDGYQTYTIPDDVQVYQVGEDGGEPYTGGQCLVILMGGGTKIGEIDDNGKLSLNLEKISSFDNPQGFEQVDFGCDVYSSLDLIGTSGDISNVKKDEDGDIEGIGSSARFFYASRDGTFNHIDAGELELKKGWNIVYNVPREGDDLYTTTQPGNLTWYWLYR